MELPCPHWLYIFSKPPAATKRVAPGQPGAVTDSGSVPTFLPLPRPGGEVGEKAVPPESMTAPRQPVSDIIAALLELPSPLAKDGDP
jgi:hypothetical protein